MEPLWPSVLGLDGTHDRLPDPSPAAEDRIRSAMRDIAGRAAAIDPSGLDEVRAVTRDVVVQQANAALDTLDSRLVEFSVSDGLSSPAYSPLTMLPSLTLNDEAKARGYLARLAALPSYLDAVADRQRRGLADGLVPPDFLVQAGVDYAQRYLGAPETDPLAIDPEIDLPDFAAERDRLLADAVRPAYARYRDFLRDELAPHAVPADRPGLGAQPGGAARYEGLIRVHTTTDRSAHELHEIGLALIEDLAAQYRVLGERVFGSTDLAEIFERLRTDPALRWRDGDELLEAARSAIRRAEAVAPQWFGLLPAGQCEVRPVPPAEAVGGTIAYYQLPALDGSRPGVYFANTFEATQRFRHTAEAIAFHEAVPGHHFQLGIALGQTEMPLLRRLADVNAFIEGWGLYAERLADEMGLYSDDVAKFGMLTQDSMRAGRLVVDTGLHALGWSRGRAVEFLAANTPMSGLEIEAEIDRYVANPAQALSYMVGRLEIERVRADAAEALGERFDIRAFHDVVLGNGNLPLSVLGDVVSRWVDGQRG
ncbi:DUF885 domain-containing protein [Amycolatopsis antarctica]|uniref:DUF885 domain-containing protein n=2 Tax=Amycolatopsis antarctica TaxID=1854586 RepID=A0A263D833_9PSEU|nr:DUF885 domain-containing protein [Amycolatopsis antarctica]